MSAHDSRIGSPAAAGSISGAGEAHCWRFEGCGDFITGVPGTACGCG